VTVAKPRALTLRQFRNTNILSGEMRVVGRSRRRRGVSSSAEPGPTTPRNAAILASSQAHDAATRDARRLNAGGVATSGNATASFGKAYAGAARGRRDQPQDTPSPSPAKPARKKKTPISSGGGDDHNGSNNHSNGSNQSAAEKPSDESLWGERVNLQGGPELPANGWEFLKAVNARIDIVRLTELILRASDEKLVTRVTEQLLEMAYEKTERPPSQEPDSDFFDIPTAIRD
jgi:hypothetical protein